MQTEFPQGAIHSSIQNLSSFSSPFPPKYHVDCSAFIKSTGAVFNTCKSIKVASWSTKDNAHILKFYYPNKNVSTIAYINVFPGNIK